MPWNYGDMLDAIEPVLNQDAPAFIHGTRTVTWGEAAQRTNRLARALIERGAKPGDKVAFYMRNRPEYMETLAACFKARLTHVNVNYRYNADEVHYIFDNSDARVIVYGSEFRDIIATLKSRLDKVITFLEISPDGVTAPFAENYQTIATTGTAERLDIQRSPDDMLFIYTGGTTGMPKGVMWRHDDLREAQLIGLRRLGPVSENLAGHVELIRAAGGGSRMIPACPLMHGTGLVSALGGMINGGCVVTLESPSFNSHEVWAEVARNKVSMISIVGDAFGKPLLAALDEMPGKYDLSSLNIIMSSGVMWSVEVKRGLLRHIPQAIMWDAFGASEAIGLGSSAMTKDGEVKTAKFEISERCKVFDENDQLVESGSGKPGVIALAPPIPSGYYKDPVKSAAIFKTINGKRYSIPGDWCIVEKDGSLTLLGRGSVCINTAGEKVHPEEIEEILKTHPAVGDALVVGVPDEKWGQAVTGVVQLEHDAAFDEDELRTFVRARLAGYKTPKRILRGTIPFRAPNGKADYKGVTDFAKRELGIG